MFLFRHIFNEIGKMFLFIFCCLFLVVLMGFSIQQMNKFGGGVVVIRELLPFMFGFISLFTVPVALLLSCSIVYTRMARDNELIALQAAGYSKTTLARPAFVLAFLLSFALLFISNVIVPQARYQRENIEAKELSALLATSGKRGNSFHLQKTIFRYESIQNGRMQNVHIVELFPNGTPSKWFSARSGRFLHLPNLDNPMLEFELKDVTVTQWDRGKKRRQSQVMKFRQQDPFVYRRNMSDEIGFDRKQIEEMTLSEMGTLINNKYKRTKQLRAYSEHRIQLEIHRRLTLSFAPLAFVLLCVPLAMLSGKQTRIGGVGTIVISALVLFYPAHIFAARIGETYELSPVLLFWPPLLLFAIAGVALIRKYA